MSYVKNIRQKKKNTLGYKENIVEILLLLQK